MCRHNHKKMVIASSSWNPWPLHFAASIRRTKSDLISKEKPDIDTVSVWCSEVALVKGSNSLITLTQSHVIILTKGRRDIRLNLKTTRTSIARTTTCDSQTRHAIDEEFSSSMSSVRCIDNLDVFGRCGLRLGMMGGCRLLSR